MPDAITVSQSLIPAGSTARLTGTITQEDGVTGFLPDDVRMWITDRNTGQTVNNRTNVDIRSSVAVGGALSLELLPADNVIVTAGRTREQHSIRIEWTWAGGTRKSEARVDYTIQALH